MAPLAPKTSNVFNTPLSPPTATLGGAGHYPPSSGGRHIDDGTGYEILGPIFGAHWKKALAITKAESKGDTHARNVNSDGSVDRGWFQINSRWHPEVTDAVAYNARGSALAAFAISKGGTDWSPWATDSIADPAAIKLPDADDAGLFGIGRGTGADTKVSDAAESISDGFLSKLGVLFKRGFWLRVLLVVGGGALLIFAVATIGKQYAPTAAIADAAMALT